MRPSPACLEGEPHSLSFLYLLHTDLWVLVSMDWLCDLDQGPTPLWASRFRDPLMGQMTLHLGEHPWLVEQQQYWELVKIQDRYNGGVY